MPILGTHSRLTESLSGMGVGRGEGCQQSPQDYQCKSLKESPFERDTALEQTHNSPSKGFLQALLANPASICLS